VNIIIVNRVEYTKMTSPQKTPTNYLLAPSELIEKKLNYAKY
jgi:hypothetical protein